MPAPKSPPAEDKDKGGSAPAPAPRTRAPTVKSNDDEAEAGSGSGSEQEGRDGGGNPYESEEDEVNNAETMQQIIVYSFVLLLLLAVGGYFACRAWCPSVCCASSGDEPDSQEYSAVSTEGEAETKPRSSSINGLSSGSKELPKTKSAASKAARAAEREKEIEMQRSARMASMPSSYPRAEVPKESSPLRSSSSSSSSGGSGSGGKGSSLGLSKAKLDHGLGERLQHVGSHDEGDKKKPVVKSGLGSKVTKLEITNDPLDDLDLDGDW